MRDGLLIALALLAGCGESPTLPPLDNVDLRLPGSCSDDSQCSAPTPRCDLNAHSCVPCLPDNDNCPRGQRCVFSNRGFTCTSACVLDADCPKSDGGAQAACCGGGCIDVSSNPQSCGRCGAMCLAPSNASAACVNGACTIGACNLGFLDCDRGAVNGCEVDASRDLRNCGSCGHACAAGAHQAAGCRAGACASACDPGFSDCDGDAANGCEVDSQVDVRNCGACGTRCTLDNALSACQGGACAIDACNAGFGDCNQQPVDGCEVDLQGDVDHCGGCMIRCAAPGGVPACRKGGCVVASCNKGFANCDNLAINGCEVATDSDANNCGSCGTRCDGPNSMQVCQMASCSIVACAPGHSDCDSRADTGCEVDVAADLANCGACGNACAAPAHATGGCANGKCGVGQCSFGFADCNKIPLDGCEVDLQNVQNCGACGNACAAPPNASAGCKGGMCAIGMCNALFGDCDGNPMNGCEKPLAADVANCGKCGTACSFANAQAGCINGQCGIVACNQGFDDCDKKAANGCEIGLDSDPNNCGGCGNVCPKNLPACSKGMCINFILFPQPSYAASMTFADGLGATTMMLAWDGVSFWSASGGSANGVRYAKYNGNGALLSTYSPGIDFRSVFTHGGNGPVVYAREFSSSQIRIQTMDGVFGNDVMLIGAAPDPQGSVVFNDVGDEFISALSGKVTRWTQVGTLIGTVTLAGFGGMNNEAGAPQNRGIAKAHGYYLTYSNGVLSAWDANGNRAKTTTLTGAGSAVASHYSFSLARNLVWIVDNSGGTWRGYDVGF